MDKLRAMQVFVRVVETGSLTRAADALGLSAPSVVRSLAALEREIGVRLLHRTTRRSSLSDEGREYYERCRRAIAAVEEADASMSARRAKPEGRMRLTAPVTYGRLHVAPVVSEFLEKYPQVAVDLLLLDRVVDLVEEGIDCALRIGRLPESTLVARPLGETRRVVCASPPYLKRHGVPANPSDLVGHRCIQFAGLSATDEWGFSGRPAQRVAIRPILRTNQMDAALDACLRSRGCGMFLLYQVETPLREGRLRRLLADFEPPPLPIQIVYPHARLLSPNVRAFVDLAIARLQSGAGPGTLPAASSR